MSAEIVLPAGLRGTSVRSPWGGVRALFAGRAPDGAGNLSLSGGRDRDAALRARRRWSETLAVAPEDWVCGALVHGATVRVVGEAERGRGARDADSVLHACDGLITATPGLPLYLPVADCAAVLLHRAGPRPRIGVLHAGWRGLAAGVIAEGVRRLREGAERDPERLFAWISPCARAPAYEVGSEVADLAPQAARRRAGARWSVDVGCWCAEALAAAGVPRGAIVDDGSDTLSDARWFSHRREGAGGGRNGLVAVLEPSGD